MIKQRSALLIALIFILFPFDVFGIIPTEELPLKYKKWLEEEAVYIISSLEKDVFLQLVTDRERELFIEAFWKHRDPTPGTPENEFKTEHYCRISYANRYFARAVPKPGWKTDRGRMYILLGEPTDIERFIGETQIYNTGDFRNHSSIPGYPSLDLFQNASAPVSPFLFPHPWHAALQ
jgi:GWxTD domain-containing protein